VSIDFGNCYMI